MYDMCHAVLCCALCCHNISHPPGLSFSFEAAFSAFGGNLAEPFIFKRGHGDPQAAVDAMIKAKTAGSDRLDGVFITANNRSFVAGFLRAAHKAKLDVPIHSGDAEASTELPTLLKDDLAALQRVTLTSFSKGSQELLGRLKAAAPKGVDPDPGSSAQAYDAVTAMLKAYAAADAPKSGADVAKQIPKQKFKGEQECHDVRTCSPTPCVSRPSLDLLWFASRIHPSIHSVS
jgi:ABC-type branched-subunit amino acid transport system substrate-binding protein